MEKFTKYLLTMKKLLFTPLLLLSVVVLGQGRQDTLKYQLSKHGQHVEKGTEYTSVFQLGDTVTTTRLKDNFSFVVGMIRWRNKKVRFEYFGGNGWFLVGDLKLK